MLENYYKYRIKYRDCILFFKYGNFYEVFDKDAYIIGKIFRYKISVISDNIKCGFPVNKLDDVINVLNNENISYFAVDKEVYKDFDDNGYVYYEYDENLGSIISRVNNVCKFFNNNLFDKDMYDILDKVEGIINER